MGLQKLFGFFFFSRSLFPWCFCVSLVAAITLWCHSWCLWGWFTFDSADNGMAGDLISSHWGFYQRIVVLFAVRYKHNWSTGVTFTASVKKTTFFKGCTVNLTMGQDFGVDCWHQDTRGPWELELGVSCRATIKQSKLTTGGGWRRSLCASCVCVYVLLCWTRSFQSHR